MRWKKYTDEQPREEHGMVLVRINENHNPHGSLGWDSRSIRANEWLDHLDDGWIPVSERLPMEHDFKSFKHHGDRRFVHAQFFNGDQFNVTSTTDCWKDGTVTAWRHLPDPYVPPERKLWESKEEFHSVLEALPRYFSYSQLDDFQRELRKRGLEIRKVEK